jgi:glycosyltransferase involved in cell wall biosynthesis
MYGGVESFLTTLAREAQSVPDMDSEFAVCWTGRFSEELGRLGSTPHVLGHVRLSRPHTMIRARRVLVDLLRRERFDVIVCHQPWSCVVFGSVVKNAGFPLVLWVHMAGEGRHWLERLARRTNPDLAICNSRFTAIAASKWLPHAQIEHVYCPVSQDPGDARGSRAQIRSVFGVYGDDMVIVQVSRLEAWKGQRVLISALSELRDLVGWTCWIVGGPQRDEETAYLNDLKTLVHRGGLDNRVRFLGERADVPAVLRAADVFCQPNTSPEPFGLSLVEALLAGLPVVTSGIGGACEIVDETCGLLTPPGDVSALADALRRLIVEPAITRRLSAAAPARPKAICDSSQQMRRIQEVLSTVAA